MIFEEESLLLSQLDEYLETMHGRTPAIVAAIGAEGLSRAFTRCKEVGQGLEFVTNTPLACGVTELADFLTTHMSGEGAAKTKGYALSYVSSSCRAHMLYEVASDHLSWLVCLNRSTKAPLPAEHWSTASRTSSSASPANSTSRASRACGSSTSRTRSRWSSGRFSISKARTSASERRRG